jgi:hypothetical protein
MVPVIGVERLQTPPTFRTSNTLNLNKSFKYSSKKHAVKKASLFYYVLSNVLPLYMGQGLGTNQDKPTVFNAAR